MDHLCNLCLVFVMLSCLFIAALWSPAGKRLTSWFLFVMFNCVFVTIPSGILGQVWYLIVSFPDLCHLSYFLTYVRSSTLSVVLTFKACFKASAPANPTPFQDRSNTSKDLFF